MRKRLSISDLKQIALKKIREHRGCHDVDDISICPMTSDGSSPNWAISCGSGGSDKRAASKAALYVEQQMAESYELSTEDACKDGVESRRST
jgi:hypothetical protein